jgi:hypothetical protein
MEISVSSARRAAVIAGAVVLAAACARRETAAGGGTAGDSSPESRAAAAVRAQYRASDVEAAGAWTWTAPDARMFVLVDVQSTIVGLVQGRADLWLSADSAPLRLGRSEVMPVAAEIGAYAFEDLTGDGLPDLFGYIADSAGVSYPVFLPGSRIGLTEEIVLAAPGWHFTVEDEHLPALVRGPAGACALQLWAAEPIPDASPEGWRWMTIGRDGSLGAPGASPPACGGAPAANPGGGAGSP